MNFNKIIFIYIHTFTYFGRALPSSGSSIFDVEDIVIDLLTKYGGADKSLARPGRKQATATEDFDVHISYL